MGSGARRGEADDHALRRPRKRWGWGRRALVGGLLGYLGVLAALLVSETWLVYPAVGFPLDERWESPGIDREEVEFESADGTVLVGWFLKGAGSHAPFLVCHGNGSDVAKTAHRFGEELRRRFAADVFVFDYRGFGKSAGTPTEQGVLEDGEAAMDWLNVRTGTRPEDVILVGHSLGGGVAVHVASTRGARALVLQRTFDSLVGVAQSRYWMFPVSWLMQNQYRSCDWIGQCGVPLFQSHGTLDQVVPLSSGQALFGASPAKQKEFFELVGGNHFSGYPPDYFDSLERFLEAVD